MFVNKPRSPSIRPRPQRPQRRRFLVLMFAHAMQQAAERGDGGRGVRALVEHDAFGPHGHGCVGHLAARRQAFGDEAF